MILDFVKANQKRLRDALRNVVAVMLCSVLVLAISNASFARATTFDDKSATDLQGNARVHDPSLIKHGKTYYVFSTGSPNSEINNGNIQIRASNDLKNWRFIGTVFKDIPAWITATLGSKPKSLWAPDISFFNGKYHLYYSASFFGSNNSLIALATNRTLDPASSDYGWIDEGLVTRTTKDDNWNAIDSHISFDKHGAVWLSSGSFWSGIKLRRLDARTGKLSTRDTTLYTLAARRGADGGGGAIEAPAILYHQGYYYLFVSFDFCCRGLKSTYKIAVGRAKEITGEYTDQQGRSMRDGGGDIIVGDDTRFTGSGGQTIYRDGKDILLVHHFYDSTDNGKSKLHIDRLTWTRDGWVSLPHATHASITTH